MGTDIHMAAERRDPVTGEWHAVPPTPKLQAFAREEYARWLDPLSKDDQMRQWAQRKVLTNWYDDRNYECFAILASVRNGSGFAGVVTGDGFKPIAEAKGLPCDASATLRTPTNRDGLKESGCDVSDIPLPLPDEEDIEEFWLGYHDFSYLTLRELQDYDWTQVTALAGVISWPEYVKRICEKKTDSPREYSGGISCRGCVTLDERTDNIETLIDPEGVIDTVGLLTVSAMARDITPPTHDRVSKWADEKLHIRVWWEETYAESAGRFYNQVLPELATIDPDPDNVRIVFGFDS